MRKYLSIIGAILLIAAALFIANKVANTPKKQKKKPAKAQTFVQIDTVQNKTIPIVINSGGTIYAKQKIDLYAEVQGVLEEVYKEFKPGTYFGKGETILRINSDEHRANLLALRSNFYSALTAIMPDLQLDFPDVYPKWNNYLTQIDIKKPLPTLPEFSNDQEKYFITGRAILNAYYNVKNAEVRLGKYRIVAPFSGYLSETRVNPGMLIRQGQQLGEFISNQVYELEVTVNADYLNILQKGKEVQLYNLDHSNSWTGIVKRINPKVEMNSQTVSVYIELRDQELREGMYLEASLKAKPVDNAYEVKRNLVVDDTKLYVLQDSILTLKTIQALHFTENTVVVQGLENGDKVLAKPVPGAYDGMVVKTQLPKKQ